MNDVRISVLSACAEARAMLTELLIEVVAANGSVSFMHPLEPERAAAFWDSALAASARGERIILGAWDGSLLAGTVTLLLDCPPNQPHRGEIAKLMTRPAHRHRGIATALLRAAESLAIARRRTLLTLDTAVEGGARALYEGLGFTLAGEIPDYALTPFGALTGTLIYWKRLGGTHVEH
jgi:ribosomal protein S18 acetylase RimI-like enzyme